MTPHPPSWAQILVDLLAAHRTRDNIAGDLLEEYRETRVPERGEAAAARWYARQALGFLWRAAWPAGLGIGATLTVRMLVDVLSPLPGNQLSARAAITTYVVMAIFAIAGFRTGRATARVSGAAVMAVAAGVIGSVIALGTTLLAMGVAEVAVHPTAQALAGLREGLDIPVHVIALVGVVLASTGGAIGKTTSRGSVPRRVDLA